MAALSNHFPNMTPEELDEFRRHTGMYTVQHWHESLGCYVASQHRSVTFALEMAGRPDTEEERRPVYAALGHHHRAEIEPAQDGRPVTIYEPLPWPRVW